MHVGLYYMACKYLLYPLGKVVELYEAQITEEGEERKGRA